MDQKRREELEHRFAFHPATTDERRDAHERVRQACLDAALAIEDLVLDSREKSLATTNLEQAMFWANAGVARNPYDGDE